MSISGNFQLTLVFAEGLIYSDEDVSSTNLLDTMNSCIPDSQDC